MPYKQRDVWHRRAREYLNEISETIVEDSKDQYARWIEYCGERLSYPNPRTVSLREMRELEFRIPNGETAIVLKCQALRTFLRWCKNEDALRWKFSHKMRVKMDGTFLTDAEIEHIRTIAKAMTIDHELLFTLGADNGLRGVDMRRLTTQNITELLAFGKSRIVGKGRCGGKPGLLRLNKDSTDTIERYLKHRYALMQGTHNERFWMIRNQYGIRPANKYDTQELAVELSNASGIYFRTHDLRRTFGNRLWRAGVRLEVIARLMRHETPNTTFRSYIGALIDEMDEGMSRIENPCPSASSH